MRTTSVLFAVIISSFFIGCGGPKPEQELGTSRQALTAAQTRVIQECSQAMWGSWWTFNETNWPTGTTYATYAYTSADIGAWNLLMSSTRYSSGAWVACLEYTGGTYTITPCYLSYGSADMPNYTCQGSCSGAYMHGGQCKPFMNLVAYRSGQYQNPGYGWKDFPLDSTIDSWSTAADQMPYATYSNIVEGDFLRRTTSTTPHAAIVVRKISSSQVIVLDSNWSGGNGRERVSSHSMGFTGSNDINDLGTYRVLKCAYTGGC